jgi:hypothetical protein
VLEVVDTTILGVSFIRRAMSGLCSTASADGQYSAMPSWVLRPNTMT